MRQAGALLSRDGKKLLVNTLGQQKKTLMINYIESRIMVLHHLFHLNNKQRSQIWAVAKFLDVTAGHSYIICSLQYKEPSTQVHQDMVEPVLLDPFVFFVRPALEYFLIVGWQSVVSFLHTLRNNNASLYLMS